MAVYIDHLDTPYPRDSRASIRHYIGYADVFSPGGRWRILQRNRHHAAGRGARLLAAVSSAGIGWRVTRVIWDATRDDERRMKQQRNAARFCPECNPALRRRRLRSDAWRIAPVPGVFVPRVLDTAS